MLNQVSRAALAVALFTAAPAVALAQAAPANNANALEGLVVSASPSGEAIATNLLGGSVSVIAAQDVEARQVRIVSDLLRDIPGVAVNRTGVVGGLTQIRIRGAEGNHTLVLVDGIYAAAPDQGEFDFSTLYADEGFRLEVLRGQQPIYGSNAIAGVIHYITATGKDLPGLQARVEAGSHHTGEGGVRYGINKGPIDFSGSASYYTTDGFSNSRFGIREQDAKNTSVNGKLTYSPLDNFRLIAVGRYSESIADTNPSDNTPGRPSTAFTIDGTNYYRVFQRMGMVRSELDLFDNHWRQGVSIQGNTTKRRSFTDIGRASSFVNGRRARYAYDTTFKFDSGDFHHTLTGKADYDHTGYRNLPLTATATPTNTKRHINNTGLVAQYDVDWKAKASLSGALRHDKNSRFLNVTTYRVSGSYLFDTGTRIRAAAGSGITNPTFTELYGFNPLTFLGNPNLKPESSKGWETGFDQAFWDNQIRFGATYFNSRLTDEIFSIASGTPGVNTPSNRATLSRQKGVEVTASARIGRQWRIDGAYTNLNAKENGVKEIRRPDNTASLNVSWRALSDRFGVTTTIRYNGEMTDTFFSSPSQLKTLPSFTLVNLDGDFKINKHLSIYGRIEDLFDTKYEEVYGFVAPARTAYIGVKAAL